MKIPIERVVTKIIMPLSDFELTITSVDSTALSPKIYKIWLECDPGYEPLDIAGMLARLLPFLYKFSIILNKVYKKSINSITFNINSI